MLNSFDERQLQLRGKIATSSLIIGLTWLVILAVAVEFGLLALSPLEIAHSVAWPTLSYFCVRAILSESYLRPGMKWLPVLVVFGGFTVLYAVALALAWVHGTIADNVSMAMMWLFFVSVLIASAIQARRTRASDSLQ